MKDIRRDGLVISRRSAMGMMGPGMLALMNAACGQPPYEVEPKVLPTPQSDINTAYYDLVAVPGEQITDRSGSESRLMYVNPVAAKHPLNPSTALYRDFSVSHRVSSGGSLSDSKNVDFPNRQIVMLPAETTQVEDLNLAKLGIANSRGNPNIGQHRVYNFRSTTADQVFHPDQLALADRNRRVFLFDTEVTGVNYHGITEEGKNVLRVLNNEHQIIFEMRKSVLILPDRKDVYRLRVTR